jgi:hypothetical protein
LTLLLLRIWDPDSLNVMRNENENSRKQKEEKKGQFLISAMVDQVKPDSS